MKFKGNKDMFGGVIGGREESNVLILLQFQKLKKRDEKFQKDNIESIHKYIISESQNIQRQTTKNVNMKDNVKKMEYSYLNAK